ncbi:MAG: PilX N-terminal domain-containing pilus assembly protein, partial [Alphaproteobacteria bacterium]
MKVKALRERIRQVGEQGFAMPWVILLLLLALTLGAATSRGSLLDVQTTQHFVNGNQAFAAAEAG